MITKAIAHLLTPPAGGYARTTPLQDAFNREMQLMAVNLVREEIHKPEVMRKVRTLITMAVEKMVVDSTRLANAMAEAFVKAMRDE